MRTRPSIASLSRALAGFACAGPVVATAADTVALAPSTVGYSQVAQVLGALGLVVVLIFGLAIGSQRLRLGRSATGRHLRVIDALALGTRERLLLVEVAGERVLLGLAGGRIERLHVLPAGGRDADASATTSHFPSALDAVLGGGESR